MHDIHAFLQHYAPVNWDDLQYFLSVARERTYGAAARRLGVDPSTVGRRIERLQIDLNTLLFEAGPTGHHLTQSGIELLASAEDVERQIFTAREQLSGERSKLSGTVRISLSEGFANWIVAPNLLDFQRLHPDIRLEIVTTNGFLNPSKREADLAVMLARPTSGALIAEKLTDYTLSLYAAYEYMASHAAPTDVASLSQHILVGYVSDFIYADELRYLNDVQSGLRPDIGSSSVNVQVAMVKAGAGLAILPDFIARQHENLVRLLPDVIHVRRSFWTVVHQDLQKVARVRAVKDWLSSLAITRSALLH